MSKKKHSHATRAWVAKRPPQDIWIEEDENILAQFAFLQKLHPDTSIEVSLQELVDLGFFSIRVNKNGKRAYRMNTENIQAARAKLPPEHRRKDLDVKIYEDIAILCGYENPLTMLLSVIIKQTDESLDPPSAPWITRTQEQLTLETFDVCPSLQRTFSALEARGFIEITENGPSHYRYRLNVPVVQAAIHALPER